MSPTDALPTAPGATRTDQSKGRPEQIKRVAAATQVALSADEMADLETIAARIGVHGNRYNHLYMSLPGR